METAKAPRSRFFIPSPSDSPGKWAEAGKAFLDYLSIRRLANVNAATQIYHGLQNVATEAKFPEEFHRYAGRIAYRVFQRTRDMQWWGRFIDDFTKLSSDTQDVNFLTSTALEFARIARAEYGRTSGAAHAKEAVRRCYDWLTTMNTPPHYEASVARERKDLEKNCLEAIITVQER